MVTAFGAGPAKGKRTRAHAEALAEMYRTARETLLTLEPVPSGCWSLLQWQAAQENPAAGTGARISALVELLGGLACHIDEWCGQIDAAVNPTPARVKPPGPEPEDTAARRIIDTAESLDRAVRALVVGAAELKYLAAELAGEQKPTADR
ncbi:MAG TPA: hypothetical protein VFS43_29770 [Polyangiaceae bacterium]|nr:hypothetical protein [Polyangiaceae bacterium]